MRFPKLTIPQSRVAVSLIASFILVVFYLSLSSPQLAYAAETDSITPKDPVRPHLLEFQDPHGLTERNAWHEDEVRQDYEPDFAGLDRGIIGRAPFEPQNLENNTPGKGSIQGGGDTHYWVFQNKTLWSPQTPVTSGLPSPLDGMNWGTSLNLIGQQNGPGGPQLVFVSLSVCDQPSSNSSKQKGPPPQLELYISVSSSNRRPGPDNNSNTVPVDGGFGNLTLNATSDIYFAVLAPASSDFNGNYSYELAVSIDAPYASYVDTQVLNFLDSDTNAALLETHVTTNANYTYNTDLYQTWMSITPPFSIFASNPNNSSVLGIHKSLCGLKNHARITGNPADQQAGSVNMSMTARAGGSPKEQFYIQKLNGTTTYYAIPAIDRKSNLSGGSVVGGGGMVWKSTSLRTKSDGNCQVIYDLSFCSEVAYAVPSNPSHINYTELTKFYDNQTSSLYANFSKSLQLVPCNTTSSAQYSLARNCTDCANAYKNWLCAVVIPRCEDFSSPWNYTWLKPRNINQMFINGTEPSTDINPMFTSANKSIMYINSSRNPSIDTTVMPGPYKEVLPCTEMCYELVRSCPPSLQFSCPLQGRGLELSYGTPSTDHLKHVTCNYLGNITRLGVGVARDRNVVLLSIACATALLMGVYV